VGTVQINPMLLERDNDFTALEAEGRAGAEAQFPIDAERMAYLANCVFVEWRSPEDSVDRIFCREWIAPEKIQKI
jgi:hypothetical protein